MKLDKDLIEGLKRREDKAYLDLFDASYSVLHELAYSYVLDYDIAHDILQEMYVNLYENVKLLAGVKNLESYLRVAVRNRCYNYLRNLALEDYHRQMYWNEYVETELNHVDQHRFELLLKEINKIMDTLPPKCKQICTMRFYDGKTVNEISKELTLSVSTVKAQMYRGLDKIRESIEHEVNAEKKEIFKDIITFSFIF
jgi:RNA polymerase sigma-70 factor (family 1)